MKKIVVMAALMAMLFFTLAVDAGAQRGMRGPGSGGWGADTVYGQMYDADTVASISGQVVEVARMTPMRGMSHGVHLMLQTDEETVSVHLGPAWYIESQDAAIEPNDRLEVKGSRIDFQGEPAMIAAEVTKGEETLVLRDENGFPVWSGWRRR